jgi:hypothetical protein
VVVKLKPMVAAWLTPSMSAAAEMVQTALRVWVFLCARERRDFMKLPFLVKANSSDHIYTAPWGTVDFLPLPPRKGKVNR